MSENSKVAVVTGAGSGLGRATSVALMRAGFDVALAGRREDALNETLRSATGSAGSGLVVRTDVRRPDSVRELFAAVRSQLGRVDVLVNNAGVFGPSEPLEAVLWTDWSAVIETNISGMFLCAQAAYAMMKEQNPSGGRIINNGSISAHVPRPHAIAYTTSKHAVSGLTKAIALEGRAHGITCGQIDIGNASTEMTGHFESRGMLQANGTVAPEPTISVEHVVSAILYMSTLPLDVSVPSLTVLATRMPFAGRG